MSVRNTTSEKWIPVFSRKYLYSEDQYFFIQALYHAQRVASIPESVLMYVQHPGSAMTKSTLRQFDYVESMKELSTFFEERECPEIRYLFDCLVIPKSVMIVLKTLIMNGYRDRRALMQVCTERGYFSLMKPIRRYRERSPKQRLVYGLLLSYPAACISIFMLVNHLIRAARGAVCNRTRQTSTLSCTTR